MNNTKSKGSFESDLNWVNLNYAVGNIFLEFLGKIVRSVCEKLVWYFEGLFHKKAFISFEMKAFLFSQQANRSVSPLCLSFRVSNLLWSRRDSNPHQENRNLSFYPLNYGTNKRDCESGKSPKNRVQRY